MCPRGRACAQQVGASGAVSQVQVRGSGSGSWQGLGNSWGAASETTHAPGFPLDIQITNDQGQQVMARRHACDRAEDTSPVHGRHACMLVRSRTTRLQGIRSSMHVMHTMHCRSRWRAALECLCCGQVTAYGAIKQDSSTSAQLPPNVQFFLDGSSPASSSASPVRML